METLSPKYVARLLLMKHKIRCWYCDGTGVMLQYSNEPLQVSELYAEKPTTFIQKTERIFCHPCMGYGWRDAEMEYEEARRKLLEQCENELG
jgi:hypothetical protein